MGVDWTPSFLGDRKVQQILSRCQSKLEVIYFLGLLYYLHFNGHQNGKGRMRQDYPLCWADTFDLHEGLWISEPSYGGYWGNGFSALFVVPQYPSPDKNYIHHDFGFFASNSKGGSNLRFLAAIEIEGYAVHRQQRKADEERYTDLSYRVIQVFEEISEPLYWYAIFDPDVETGILGEYRYLNKKSPNNGSIDPFDDYINLFDEIPNKEQPKLLKQLYIRNDGVHQQSYTRGDRIYHPTFGEGVVLKSELEGQNELIDVQFQYDKKRLRVDLAKLARLSKIPLTLDSIKGSL